MEEKGIIGKTNSKDTGSIDEWDNGQGGQVKLQKNNYIKRCGKEEQINIKESQKNRGEVRKRKIQNKIESTNIRIKYKGKEQERRIVKDDNEVEK